MMAFASLKNDFSVLTPLGGLFGLKVIGEKCENQITAHGKSPLEAVKISPRTLEDQDFKGLRSQVFDSEKEVLRKWSKHLRTSPNRSETPFELVFKNFKI